jgi:methionine-rich copper-binding protein CopC
VTFSEPVGSSFALDDIALTGTLAAAATAQIGGTDPNYTVTATPGDPNASGDIAISIGAGVTDASGNALTPVGPSPKIVIDNAPPAVTIAPVAGSATNADSSAFAVTFSEAVAPTFAPDDLALTGTLASAATVQLGGADPSYTATVTPNDPNADGTLGIVVGTGITDAAGNALPAAATGPLTTFDNAAPTVAVTATTPSPTNADSVAFAVTFNEPVAPTFALDDLALTGTLAASATAQIGGADTAYAVNVALGDPNADGTIGVTVGQDITDIAGNKLAAGAASPLITMDNQPVTATITPTTPTVTGAGAVAYKVELSKSLPSGLAPDKVVVTGSFAGAASAQVTGQDNQYVVTVTPNDPKASGTLGITLGSDVKDAAGNPVNVPAPPANVTVDKTPPVLTITPVTPSPTRADAVAFNLVFSEPVSPSFTIEDISLAGTLGPAAATQLAGLDPGYTVVVTPNDPNATGTIAVVVGTSVTDVAGNALAEAVTSQSVIVDKTPPAAKIDLVTTSTTGASSLLFGVTFSEPVAPTFNSNNLALAGTLAADASAQIAGADPVYSVTVSLNDPNASGTLGIVIGAGVSDAAGNTYPGGASELYHK